MKKKTLQEIYSWVLKRMTPDEQKKIETKNKKLLKAGQLGGIEYNARLEIIFSILTEQN